MVTLRVTESSDFDPWPLVLEFEAETRNAAVAGYLSEHSSDRRFEPTALITLLAMHDDLRIGGPTWDVRFEQIFSA